MGYSTDFEGQFALDKPLTAAHAKYLRAFNQTRRMHRRADVAAGMPDPVREAAGLPIGDHGAYFVGAGGDFGQSKDASLIDYNYPPPGQPGLWCNWSPADGDAAIEWDGGEKFYDYVEWLEYLIEHFLRPWGYTLSGEVAWQGEDAADFGKILVTDNVVTTLEGRREYGPANKEEGPAS